MFLFLLAETQTAETLAAPFEAGPDLTWSFLKVLGVLIVVCLAAYLAIRYLLPRGSFLKAGKQTQIEILERFPLEPKKNLYLLKIAEQTVLIGVTDHSVNYLLEIKRPEFEKEIQQKT